MFDNLFVNTIVTVGGFYILYYIFSTIDFRDLTRDEILGSQHKAEMRCHDFLVQMRKEHIKNSQYQLELNFQNRTVEMRFQSKIVAVATFEELQESPFEMEGIFVQAIKDHPALL